MATVRVRLYSSEFISVPFGVLPYSPSGTSDGGRAGFLPVLPLASTSTGRRPTCPQASSPRDPAAPERLGKFWIAFPGEPTPTRLSPVPPNEVKRRQT